MHDPRMLQQLIRVGSHLMLRLERLLQEVFALGRDVRGYRRFRGGPDLEDGLHLVERRIRMVAREHLDDEAPDAPDICFARVAYLLDDFGRHPVDGALQGRTMSACATAQERYSAQSQHHVKGKKYTGNGTYSLPPSSKSQSPKS